MPGGPLVAGVHRDRGDAVRARRGQPRGEGGLPAGLAVAERDAGGDADRGGVAPGPAGRRPDSPRRRGRSPPAARAPRTSRRRFRPMRSSTAGAVPPIQIGMARPGRGLTPARGTRSKRPSKSTIGSAQRRRSSPTCSSRRRPRVRKSSPSASYSTRFQPLPTPRISRPPESRSTSAACLATSAVWRWGRISTPVASSMRAVCPASQAKSASGSWKGCRQSYGPGQGPPRSAGSAPSTWS